jgi:hypothetical protein
MILLKRKLNIFCLITIFLLISGCSLDNGTPKSTIKPSITPKILNFQPADCTRLEIPKNTELNTNLNREKETIEVAWYDNSKGTDVGYRFKYTDPNCSESVNQLIKHVLSTPE